jgi:hypothetical protein
MTIIYLINLSTSRLFNKVCGLIKFKVFLSEFHQMRYQLRPGNSPIRLTFPPWLFLIIKMLHLEAFYIDLSQSASQHFIMAKSAHTSKKWEHP